MLTADVNALFTMLKMCFLHFKDVDAQEESSNHL